MLSFSFIFEFYALIPFLSVPNFDVVFFCQENELSPLQQSGLKQARMMLESMAEVRLDLKGSGLKKVGYYRKRLTFVSFKLIISLMPATTVLRLM